jgi:PKD domain
MIKTSYVTVYAVPTVDFSASPVSGCFPLRVQFQDLSNAGPGNTIVSWLWDFGDGYSSSQQNPLATYGSSGIFSVTLRVTNDKGCTRVFSRPNYINVTTGVTAGFTNTQATVCRPPADISFTNTSTGPPTLSCSHVYGQRHLYCYTCYVQFGRMPGYRLQQPDSDRGLYNFVYCTVTDMCWPDRDIYQYICSLTSKHFVEFW